MGNVCAAGTDHDRYRDRENESFLSIDAVGDVKAAGYVKARTMTIEGFGSDEVEMRNLGKGKRGRAKWLQSMIAAAAERSCPPIPSRSASLIPFMLLDLPPVSRGIMLYLSYSHIAKCRQVCQRWSEIATPVLRSQQRMLTIVSKTDSSKQWSTKVFPSISYTLSNTKIQTYRPIYPHDSDDIEAPEPMSILPSWMGEMRLVPFDVGEVKVFDKGIGEGEYVVGVLDDVGGGTQGTFAEWVFGRDFWVEFLPLGGRGIKSVGIAVDGPTVYSTTRLTELETTYSSLNYPPTLLSSLSQTPALLRYLSTSPQTLIPSYRSILSQNLSTNLETGHHTLIDIFTRLDRVMHRVDILERVGNGKKEKMIEYIREGARIWRGVKGWEGALRICGYRGALEDDEGVWKFLWDVVVVYMVGRMGHEGGEGGGEWEDI